MNTITTNSPPMSHELAAGLPDARSKILRAAPTCRNCNRPELFLATIGDFLEGGIFTLAPLAGRGLG
jgi:hypothetical protein